MIISLTLTYIGTKWPKFYTSSTSIYVEYKNIIDPLMEGTAVRTDVTHLAANAKEILDGRSVILQILEQIGQLDQNMNPKEEDQLIQEIKQQISISNIGNVVKIEYRDHAPERAFKITRIMGDLLIHEMLTAKTRESQGAFDFINAEVIKYENVLNGIQQQLKQLRVQNWDAQPELSSQVGENISALNSRISDIERKLRDAKITQESLSKQLSSEAETYSTLLDAERNQARIAGLEAELDKLLLSYTEAHPDVVWIKRQIADLRKSFNLKEKHTRVSVNEGFYPMDENKGLPLYQILKQKSYETETQITTLQANLAEAKLALAHEQERLQRIRESETAFRSLERDYNIAENVYQDLLQKRERARVSLSIDTEQANLNIRIIEPAFLPHQPSGPGLMHFAVGGVVLGSALPITLLFGVLMIDQRIRMPGTIIRELKLPLLEVVPHLAGPEEKRKQFKGLLWLSLVIMLTLVGIMTMLWLRFQGEIP